MSKLAGTRPQDLNPPRVSLQPEPPACRKRQWRGGEALRNARTCYDHLAGRIAVCMADHLVERSHVVLDRDVGTVTTAGLEFLDQFGIELHRPTRRVFCRPCLDCSERRPHLAGAVGAALLRHFLERDWVRRVPDCRALSITPLGRRQFFETFGIDVGNY